MFRLVMLAKMFARAVEASFHRGDTGVESLGNLGVAATFLHEGQERAILRTELAQRMAQGIELLGVDRARRLGNVFVLFAEGEKNPPQFLPTQLIDARVARESEKPRLELRRRLQTIECSNHLDEHLLGEVLHIITSA